MSGKREYTAERRIALFWSRVNKNGRVPVARPDLGPCWIWTGTLYNKNAKHGSYGRVAVPNYKGVGAHCFAYEITVGPIPDGLEIDHLCRVRSCVNPSHLEAVTRRTNLLRGKSPIALNAQKTHCVRGHSFDESNTYIRQDGRRAGGRCCRACIRERARIKALAESDRPQTTR